MADTPSPNPTPPLWRTRLLTLGQKLAPWIAPIQAVLLASVAATGVVAGVRAVGGLQGMELALYDQMVRLRPDEGPDPRLLVVGITETDIQSRQEWPISDRTIAELLTKLKAAQPRAIGLDLFRDVPIEPGHAALTQEVARNDRLFAVCKMSSSDNPGVPPPTGLPPTQVGFSDVVVDPGGTLRRSLLIAAPPAFKGTLPVQHLCNTPNTQLWSLGFQLTLAYLTAENIAPSQDPDGAIRWGKAVLPQIQPSTGGYQDSDSGGYQIMLNYRSEEQPATVVSLSDVLSGQVGGDQIRDRIVLIGYTTPQAKDEFYTPYSGGRRDSQKMPGVLIHAQSVSQLLSAALDGRPLLWTWSTPQEGLWILVWGVAGAVFAARVRRPLWFTLGTLGLLGALYGISYGLFLKGGWIPLVPPMGALVLAAGGVVLIDRFNRSTYGQAVYRQVKTLLRLDIEVDEHKVEKQVAEIIQTDYFSDLQERARELRQRSRADHLAANSDRSAADSQEVTPTQLAEDDFGNYLSRLQQQAKQFKKSDEGAIEAPPQDSDESANLP